jgi:hypothetical protein
MPTHALHGILALILAAPAVAVELPVATGRITFVETVPGSPPVERFKSVTEYDGETLTLPHVSEEGGAVGRGVLSLSDVPSVTAVATSSAAGLYAQTYSSAVYYMSVQGSSGTLVPIRMRGLLEASDGATFRFSDHFAQALLGVRDNLTNESMGEWNLLAHLEFSNPVQRQVVDQMLDLRAGSVYRINMQASAGAQGMNAEYESARITSRAFVDPYFNIDPGFLSWKHGPAFRRIPPLEAGSVGLCGAIAIRCDHEDRDHSVRARRARISGRSRVGAGRGRDPLGMRRGLGARKRRVRARPS